MELAYLCLPFIFISLVIIFQPEIRRWLKHVRRVNLSFIGSMPADLDTEGLAKGITQIVIAIKELAKSKHGALIVVERPETQHDYLSPGTEINGDISSDLILSIFNPKSPLHDGAIVIQEDKIKGAGVILPITDNRKLSHIYGTRHRAALGLTEILDCICIVVSEETGSVSVAFQSKLLSCKQAEELTYYLSQFYSQLPTISQPALSESANTLSNANISRLQSMRDNNDNSQSDDNLAQAADA